MSADEWSDASSTSSTPHGSQSGTNALSNYDYTKLAKEFEAAVDKSSLGPRRILEPCILNDQTTDRIKHIDGVPVYFPFDDLTNIASDESAKKHIMKLINGMRAAVDPYSKTFKQSLVEAPRILPKGSLPRRISPRRSRILKPS